MRYTSARPDYLIKPCEVEVLAISSERALERRTCKSLPDDTRPIWKSGTAKQSLFVRRLERLQAQIVHSEKMASVGQTGGRNCS